MKLTLSVIKADIGSIGGHIQPSALLLDTVRGYIAEHGKDLLTDSYISFTGDDIASLLRDTERYVAESVWSRTSDEQAISVSTSRLHNIAGKYTGITQKLKVPDTRFAVRH